MLHDNKLKLEWLILFKYLLDNSLSKLKNNFIFEVIAIYSQG